jgi:hypothetical protein
VAPALQLARILQPIEMKTISEGERTMKSEASRVERWLLILLLALGPILLTGCGYLAAGAAGGVIGHEIAEEQDEDDDDND